MVEGGLEEPGGWVSGPLGWSRKSMPISMTDGLGRWVVGVGISVEWDHFDRPARGEIGKIAKRLIERRQSICVENEIGLTDLYNQVDDGA